MAKSLEDYFRTAVANTVVDFHLRANVEADGRVTFYLHPLGVDGDTLDMEVDGNSLSANRDVIQPSIEGLA